MEEEIGIVTVIDGGFLRVTVKDGNDLITLTFLPEDLNKMSALTYDLTMKGEG